MDYLSLEDKMMVRDIYESIVKADWFNRNAITERELFVSIVGKVRRELPQNILEECRAEALERFSK
jgi:hypothetical protein